jgi:hypothetical protein
MPSTDAPNWWADVQQEREDLAGSSRRPADDWLGEDIDFIPRRRIGRAAATAVEQPAAPRLTADRDGSAHPLHGVFVPTATHAPLSAADDPFATPPPPVGTRRTVQIKGRPTESRMPSMAQRHRGRTASDRIGARPDRIALWAVALGAILILLAAMTSSSQAAVAHHAATAPAVSAHVVHTTTHHAPLRATARD